MNRQGKLYNQNQAEGINRLLDRYKGKLSDRRRDSQDRDPGDNQIKSLSYSPSLTASPALSLDKKGSQKLQIQSLLSSPIPTLSLLPTDSTKNRLMNKQAPLKMPNQDLLGISHQFTMAPASSAQKKTQIAFFASQSEQGDKDGQKGSFVFKSNFNQQDLDSERQSSSNQALYSQRQDNKQSSLQDQLSVLDSSRNLKDIKIDPENSRNFSEKISTSNRHNSQKNSMIDYKNQKMDIGEGGEDSSRQINLLKNDKDISYKRANRKQSIYQEQKRLNIIQGKVIKEKIQTFNRQRGSEESSQLKTVKFDSSLKSNQDFKGLYLNQVTSKTKNSQLVEEFGVNQKLNKDNLNQLSTSLRVKGSIVAKTSSNRLNSLNQDHRSKSNRASRPDSLLSSQKFMEISPLQIVKNKIERIWAKKAKKTQPLKFDLNKSHEFMNAIQNSIIFENSKEMDQSMRLQTLLNRKKKLSRKFVVQDKLQFELKKNDQMSEFFSKTGEKSMLSFQYINSPAYQKQFAQTDYGLQPILSFQDMCNINSEKEVKKPSTTIGRRIYSRLQSKHRTQRTSRERLCEKSQTQDVQNSSLLNNSDKKQSPYRKSQQQQQPYIYQSFSGTVGDREITMKQRRLDGRKFMPYKIQTKFDSVLFTTANIDINQDLFNKSLDLNKQRINLVSREFQDQSSLKLLGLSDNQNKEEIIPLDSPLYLAQQDSLNRKSILELAGKGRTPQLSPSNNYQINPVLAQQILAQDNKMTAGNTQARMLKEQKLTPSFPMNSKLPSSRAQYNDYELQDTPQKESDSQNKHQTNYQSKPRGSEQSNQRQSLVLNSDRLNSKNQQKTQAQNLSSNETYQLNLNPDQLILKSVKMMQTPYAEVRSLKSSPVRQQLTVRQQYFQNNDQQLSQTQPSSPVNIQAQGNPGKRGTHQPISQNQNAQLRQLRIQNNDMLINLVKNYTSQRERHKILSKNQF